jgi:hypothetical protein
VKGTGLDSLRYYVRDLEGLVSVIKSLSLYGMHPALCVK